MKKFFSNIFPFKRRNLSDLSMNKLFVEDKDIYRKKEYISGSASAVKKIFKATNEPLRLDNSDFNYNIDRTIDEIVKAKEVDGYISRVLANFREKAVKTGFYFEGEKRENVEKVKKHLENILINSGSSTELFLQQCFSNFSSFGNIFIHKSINPVTESIERLTILPSKGWTPKKSYGVQVIEWDFMAGEISHRYTNKNIFHLYYEKETHHVFGIPLAVTALDDAAIYREMETSHFQDYLDSLEKKTLVYVGDSENKATREELDETASYLDRIGPNEDIVLGGHIRVETIKPQFNDKGVQVLEAVKNRVLSSLRSSGTSVGEKGAGRQDADTLDAQDDVVVEDLQASLENQLNITLIREICFDLFGEVNYDTQVKIRFNPTFTTRERKEKHEIFKFLSNAITIEELRDKLGETEQYDEKKLYGKIFESSKGTTQQEASVRTNPVNQHGAKGNSKSSVKN